MDVLKSGLTKLKTAAQGVTQGSPSNTPTTTLDHPTAPRAWLHGYLYITVEHASNVCGDHIRMLRHGAKLPLVGDMLHSVDTSIKNVTSQMRASDCYLALNLRGSKSRLRTSIKSSRHPRWNEQFSVAVADFVSQLEFLLKDHDAVGAGYIGRFVIPVDATLLSGQLIRGGYPLTTADGVAVVDSNQLMTRVQVSVQYRSVQMDASIYQAGVPGFGHIPANFFPLHPGCSLRLYADAHCPEAGRPIPEIPLDGGGCFEPRSCWSDMYADILRARQFVYVAGWSVQINTMLVREGPLAPQCALTLGELLKLKASEGCTVLMLVWDDTTGVMNTRCEDTRRFFKDSGVCCRVVSRTGAWGSSAWMHVKLQTMFSHHQKLVICDKPADQAPGHPPAQGIALGVPVQDAATGTAALHPVAPSAPPAPYPEEATPFAATGPPQGPRPLYPAPPMDDDDVPPPPDTSVAPPPMQAPPSQASWGPMLQSLTSLTDAVLGRKPSTAVPTADVLAYVGGLDVTLGRYDTPQHALFATLTTTHASDFLNKCLPGSSVAAGGCRCPWHDVHSRISGAAALDVMHNFEQRWIKQAGVQHRLKLVDRARLEEDVKRYQQASIVAPDSWSVQLFRSIDSNSAHGLPTDNPTAFKMGIKTSKKDIVDASIHTAYIHAIRSAQRFIYIENQYFLGSSHVWPKADQPKGAPTDNLVPVELALKICSKIAAGEPFCAYVVAPMHPDGDPHSAAVQEVMCWQYRTISAVYSMVGGALKAAGRASESPLDYFQVLCLGNREPSAGTPSPMPSTPTSMPSIPSMPETPVGVGASYPAPPVEDGPSTRPSAQGSLASGASLGSGSLGGASKANERILRIMAMRRFMIYVHSKMMLVDDDYIIVGSANINNRSLTGQRDTEIAAGCYQPTHVARNTLAAKGRLPRGQVHGFRMFLWREHTGMVEPCYYEPHLPACARRVRQIAEANWAAYTAATPTELPHGHLLPYPLQVAQDGGVHPLPGWEMLPDTKAAVMGKDGMLPDFLTG